MEKGGQRVEAESSSTSAGGVVVVQENSDAVGEETEVELGGRDVEDEEVDADEDEEAGADGFVPSPLIPLKDQLEKDKVLMLFLLPSLADNFFFLRPFRGDFRSILP